VGPAISEYLSSALSDSIRTEVAANPTLALPLLAACFAVGQGGGTLPAHLSVGHATDVSRDGKQELLEAFRYFDEMPDEELLASIARMFANTLDVRDSFVDQKLKYSSSPEAGRRALVAQLVDVVEPRAFPEFDAVVYFDGVKKPLIAAAFKEITGEAIKDGKKADMAATTAKLAVEHGWLPIALRNVSYGGPGADAAIVQEAAE
jgi:ParB family chromosome partitioning protein